MRQVYLNKPRITVENCLRQKDRREYAKGILAGLQKNKKRISSIFFYDDKGSKLFKEITGLREYYLYRKEMELLKKAGPLISNFSDEPDVVEIGSGDCSKISVLLESIPENSRKNTRYIPLDISLSAVEESACRLNRKFPQLRIHGVVADFMSQLESLPNGRKSFFCFLGSTLGNMSRGAGINYLRRLSGYMNFGDHFLLGVDMVKEEEVLNRAYNDSKNITARFNKNILNVVNSYAETNFNPEDFKHIAFFNRKKSRVEMHLKAKKEINITSPFIKEGIRISEGELLHTENSHKFTPEDIQIMASVTGLKIENIFTDKNQWYYLVEFVKSKSL